MLFYQRVTPEGKLKSAAADAAIEARFAAQAEKDKVTTNRAGDKDTA